jgi:excisionase family DNA binding protein
MPVNCKSRDRNLSWVVYKQGRSDGLSGLNQFSKPQKPSEIAQRADVESPADRDRDTSTNDVSGNSRGQVSEKSPDKREPSIRDLLASIVDLARNNNASAVAAIQPIALSIEKAADYIGVPPPTIRHLIKTRKLAYVQVGDQRGQSVLIKDLDAFAQSRRQLTGDELRRKRTRA